MAIPSFLKILLRFLLLSQKHEESPKAGLFFRQWFYFASHMVSCAPGSSLYSSTKSKQKTQLPLKCILSDCFMLPPNVLVINTPNLPKVLLVSSLSVPSILVIILGVYNFHNASIILDFHLLNLLTLIYIFTNSFQPFSSMFTILMSLTNILYFKHLIFSP